jgi:organic hydroperoxide reductase OsmC/OhrA
MQSTWTTSTGAYSSEVAIPPEFSGPGGGLSPEDLFNHALSNCFLATFKVYAANSKLEFSSVEAQGDLVVDFDDDKKPVMKSLALNVKIEGASNPEKARLLAEKAAKSGFILNSVKTKCDIKIEVL